MTANSGYFPELVLCAHGQIQQMLVNSFNRVFALVQPILVGERQLANKYLLSCQVVTREWHGHGLLCNLVVKGVCGGDV